MYDGEMSRGKCPFPEGQCPFHSVGYWCYQQKSYITLTTVERVVDDCTEFITHCDEKMCGLNKQNLVAVATSLEHIDRLLHDAQQRGLRWANAGSATSSTYVGS